jgi:hypothetical protein
VEDIPKRFGGSHEWEFGMHPLLDEETKQLIGDMETEWVQGPMRCVSREEKDERGFSDSHIKGAIETYVPYL